MSKRVRTNSRTARPKDYWRTPRSAVQPLVPHLTPGKLFEEPVAGDGAIIRALAEHNIFCARATDLLPRGPGIQYADALTVTPRWTIITNPPYRDDLCRPLLDHWIGVTDCWLLLPLDFAANIWTNPYMRHVRHMLPIGRVSWMENGQGGYENFCWFYFDIEPQGLILERG